MSEIQQEVVPRCPSCLSWYDDYRCTLGRGHAGDHQAYDSDGMWCAQWPQEPARVDEQTDAERQQWQGSSL